MGGGSRGHNQAAAWKENSAHCTAAQSRDPGAARLRPADPRVPSPPTEAGRPRLGRSAPPLPRRPRPLVRLQSAARRTADAVAVAVAEALLLAAAWARWAARPPLPGPQSPPRSGARREALALAAGAWARGAGSGGFPWGPDLHRLRHEDPHSCLLRGPAR